VNQLGSWRRGSAMVARESGRNRGRMGSEPERERIVRMTRKRPSLVAVLLTCGLLMIAGLILRSFFALTRDQSGLAMAIPVSLVGLWRFGFFRRDGNPT